MSNKEYIEREAFLQRLLNDCVARYPSSFYIGLRVAAEEIGKQPTADVVEVVRCKDCKHWLKDVAGCTDFVGRCEWANYMVGANGYCVYGEAKMDGKGEGE